MGKFLFSIWKSPALNLALQRQNLETFEWTSFELLDIFDYQVIMQHVNRKYRVTKYTYHIQFCSIKLIIYRA